VLAQNPPLIGELAHLLLDAHFPETLHDEIVALAGIDFVQANTRTGRLRDPRFRDGVLEAYEYRCGLCGYDGRLRNSVVGLEAAHVRWHQFFGPDTIENGITLCSLHHKLFDQGAWSITNEWTVAVSQVFVGRSELVQRLIRRAGTEIIGPQSAQPRVIDEHLEWHREQVFRSPARAPAGDR
jgi:putative restriction endonuclease